MQGHRAHSAVCVVEFDRMGLRYTGGHRIFSNLSHQFLLGGFYFLTGTSGVGKTSLLKLIYRGLLATEGHVRVFGRDLARLRPSEIPYLRQHMGLVFQDCRLIPHLTIIDNVALALRITGTDLTRARYHAIELLKWVGLTNQLNELPQVLSDGEKQRVAIARAVITRPKLLLADEPTGNVDEGTAARLMHLFEEMNRIGTTVLLATHNRTLVTTHTYPEVHLDNGQLYESYPEKSRAYG